MPSRGWLRAGNLRTSASCNPEASWVSRVLKMSQAAGFLISHVGSCAACAAMRRSEPNMTRGGGGASVVPERVDELALIHLRAPLYAEVSGAVLQLLLRPLLVAGRPAASFACRRTRGVGDPRRLLLALPLLAQLLVLLVVLDARPVILGHLCSSSRTLPDLDLLPAVSPVPSESFPVGSTP